MKQYVDDADGLFFKLSAIGFAGFPDRMAVFPGGRIVFIELKQKGKKPRKLQLYYLRKLARLGFHTEVVDSTEQAKKVVNRYGR